MKRIFIAVCAFMAIACLAGCLDDGNPTSAPAPDNSLSIPGTPVNKASLINTLWGITEEPDADADALCVATSTLSFDTTSTFMIKKTVEKTDYNSTPVAIVSSLSAVLPADKPEGRGSCPEGDLKYIISASDIAPIDIELAESLKSRQNLEAKAGANPTPYPSGCRIDAHFEKSGNELALETAPDAEDNPEENADEAAEAPADENPDEAPADLNKSVEEEAAAANENSGDKDATDEVPVYSLKLIVDNYDCSEEMKIPERIITPQPYQNQQNLPHVQ